VTALSLSVLVASLLGSLHCAGMCGGFVAFYAGDSGRRAGHLAYNLGRLIAYATLGAVAGALGAALDLGGALLGIQRVAAVVAGAFIVLWGTVLLVESLGQRVPRLHPPSWLQGSLLRGLRRIAGWRPVTRALATGLLTGGLPCGWLYAFVVTAAGTGSGIRGAALMIVFWLGTLPVMVSLGVGLRGLAGPLRRYVPAACATAMILVGLYAVAGRMSAALPGPAPHQHLGSHATR
jgi:sulfite exporter TauE/SafE